jgi:hypothetical protein
VQVVIRISIDNWEPSLMKKCADGSWELYRMVPHSTSSPIYYTFEDDWIETTAPNQPLASLSTVKHVREMRTDWPDTLHDLVNYLTPGHMNRGITRRRSGMHLWHNAQNIKGNPDIAAAAAAAGADDKAEAAKARAAPALPPPAADVDEVTAASITPSISHDSSSPRCQPPEFQLEREIEAETKVEWCKNRSVFKMYNNDTEAVLQVTSNLVNLQHSAH